jgi:hypothetical protein
MSKKAVIPSSTWAPLLALLLAVTFSGCGDDDPVGPSPASISELFGSQLYRADGIPEGTQILETKTLIGVYFASPGCPACGAFTPLLLDAYLQLQEAGRSFEVVLVSLGVSDATLRQYMVETGMPWLAVSPQSEQANALVQRYNVRWVPTLVIIDNAGSTVSLQGREEVSEHGSQAYEIWLAARSGG